MAKAGHLPATSKADGLHDLREQVHEQAGWTMENAHTLTDRQTAHHPLKGECRRHPGRRVTGRLLVGLAALCLLAPLPVGAATLYRYINDKGYQEIGYSVPTHLVPNGYDVIDDSGRLIRRVAAQLSEEEYAAKLEQERKLEACEKAFDRVHRRYERLEDIDHAEAQFISQLEESLQNAQANLEYNRTELAKYRDNAAVHERKGQIVPKQVLEGIEQTERTIRNLTAQINQGELSRGAKADEFDEERRVFRMNGCDEEQLAQASW